ncbi:hypothetical protein NQ317_001791 [Molorchus minor]|uniref:Uncharacterized protein n=1 Tax=Molorchus minor TaxID=1323400 RepID=A0ABQ9JCR4_9CUCU|nr:hypothetical protein NQ317_001791 [Molorchus minor]
MSAIYDTEQGDYKDLAIKDAIWEKIGVLLEKNVKKMKPHLITKTQLKVLMVVSEIEAEAQIFTTQAGHNSTQTNPESFTCQTLTHFHLKKTLNYFQLKETFNHFQLKQTLTPFHLKETFNHFQLKQTLTHLHLKETLNHSQLIPAINHFQLN